MEYKKRIYEIFVIFFMLGLTALSAIKSSGYKADVSGAATPETSAFGAGEEKQLHLIQATTFEDDYKGMAELGLAYTPYLEEADLQKAFQNVLCSCVRFQVKGHYGSGSIYKMTENEIILVTNRHVLQYWDEDSYVTFFNGRVSEGTALGVSEKADVGFVSIPVGKFTYEELLFFRGVRMERENAGENKENDRIAVPKSNTEFFMADMASEWNEPVMKQGKVIEPVIYLEDFQAEMLYGNGDAIPGMSGCGVFDGHGYYLGKLSGGTLQSEVAAVPAQTIYVQYEEIVKNKR